MREGASLVLLMIVNVREVDCSRGTERLTLGFVGKLWRDRE